MARKFLLAGSIAMLLGVLAGTFGAHGLSKMVGAEQHAWFETGVRYHMYHALALLAMGWMGERISTMLMGAVLGLFVAGIVFFSGTLYVMAITNVRELGAVAPIGGMCFFAGWVVVIVAAVKSSKG